MPGFSDSHWFRKAFGAATVYGFFPQRELGLFEASPLIHGADERVAVTDLELAARFFADLCRRGARLSETNGAARRERRERRPTPTRPSPSACASAGWRFATAC